jgi:aspartate kinase
MGHTTDELTGLANALNDSPAQREMDMLLASGEQVSSALLAMALHSEGVAAVSMTGPQVGIATESTHGRARILEIRTDRIRNRLSEGKSVVVAAFKAPAPAVMASMKSPPWAEADPTPQLLL